MAEEELTPAEVEFDQKLDLDFIFKKSVLLHDICYLLFPTTVKVFAALKEHTQEDGRGIYFSEFNGIVWSPHKYAIANSKIYLKRFKEYGYAFSKLGGWKLTELGEQVFLKFIHKSYRMPPKEFALTETPVENTEIRYVILYLAHLGEKLDKPLNGPELFETIYGKGKGNFGDTVVRHMIENKILYKKKGRKRRLMDTNSKDILLTERGRCFLEKYENIYGAWTKSEFEVPTALLKRVSKHRRVFRNL